GPVPSGLAPRRGPAAISARSRSTATDLTSSGPAVGRGIVGKSVITVSPTWHCIAVLHPGPRSSGAGGSFSTSEGAPTSTLCALLVPQLAQVYGISTVSSWTLGLRSSRVHSFSTKVGGADAR